MKDFSKYFDENIFAFDGEKNILLDEHIGITSDIASILTPYSSATALKCFQGIPYTCSPFDFDVRINGEKISCDSWKWLPSAILRTGKTPDLKVETLTAIVPQSRTVVIKLRVINSGAEMRVPLCVATADFAVLRKAGPSRYPNSIGFLDFPSPLKTTSSLS